MFINSSNWFLHTFINCYSLSHSSFNTHAHTHIHISTFRLSLTLVHSFPLSFSLYLSFSLSVPFLLSVSHFHFIGVGSILFHHSWNSQLDLLWFKIYKQTSLQQALRGTLFSEKNILKNPKTTLELNCKGVCYKAVAFKENLHTILCHITIQVFIDTSFKWLISKEKKNFIT